MYIGAHESLRFEGRCFTFEQKLLYEYLIQANRFRYYKWLNPNEFYYFADWEVLDGRLYLLAAKHLCLKRDILTDMAKTDLRELRTGNPIFANWYTGELTCHYEQIALSCTETRCVKSLVLNFKNGLLFSKEYVDLPLSQREKWERECRVAVFGRSESEAAIYSVSDGTWVNELEDGFFKD